MPEGSSETTRSEFLGLRIKPAYLISGVVLLAGAQNLLLLPFLGIANPWIYLFGGLVLIGAAAVLLLDRRKEQDARPTLLNFLICLLMAAVLLLLGGEGRLFYANIDWQIRDAVTGDMIRNNWPFIYQTESTAYHLRAPIGMYILPALAGKFGGMPAADVVLLIQNVLFLAALMTLGSLLFETNQSRLLALLVLLIFSGMDVVGQFLGDPAKALDPLAHMEGWVGLQYSSTLTLLFWVPQHALVGWCAAIFFLLWRRGIISLGAFLSPLPLLALWSPLALMGAAPFAAYAGIRALLTQRISISDVAVPTLTTLLAIAGLMYQQAGSDTVGARILPIAAGLYILFQLLEIVPYLAAAWLLFLFGRPMPLDALTISSLCLLFFPFVQIGWSSDFMMRASIPALLIVALATAQGLQWQPQRYLGLSRAVKLGLTMTLVVGAFTPAHELARAVAMQPTPYPGCNLIGSWKNSDFPGAAAAMPSQMTTYLAPVKTLPKWLQPPEATIDQGRTAPPCWDRPWQLRR